MYYFLLKAQGHFCDNVVKLQWANNVLCQCYRCVSAATPSFGRPGTPPSPVSSVCVCVCVCMWKREREVQRERERELYNSTIHSPMQLAIQIIKRRIFFFIIKSTIRTRVKRVFCMQYWIFILMWIVREENIARPKRMLKVSYFYC